MRICAMGDIPAVVDDIIAASVIGEKCGPAAAPESTAPKVGKRSGSASTRAGSDVFPKVVTSGITSGIMMLIMPQEEPMDAVIKVPVQKHMRGIIAEEAWATIVCAR